LDEIEPAWLPCALRRRVSALAGQGVRDVPSVEELFLFYGRNIMHDMVSSMLNPYDMQSAEVTTITAGRSLRAAHDLDLLGALAGR
jgi:hypothetical protein